MIFPITARTSRSSPALKRASNNSAMKIIRQVMIQKAGEKASDKGQDEFIVFQITPKGGYLKGTINQ